MLLRQSTRPLTAEQTEGEKIALPLLTQKKYAEAAQAYGALARKYHDVPAFWSNLAVALRHVGHRETALACARRALELEPDELDYIVNTADSLSPLNRYEEAAGLLARAVKEDPANALFRRKYGTILKQLGKFDEAIAEFDAACKIRPDAETLWQRSNAQLSQGKLLAGWKDYEQRWERGTMKKTKYSVPQWTGQDLKGKTILIYEEQGFGDTILGARYVPLVKKRGARVLFGCRPALHQLFEKMTGVDRLVKSGPLGETFDYHSPVLSLPGVFETTMDTIPPPARLCPAKTIPADAEKLLKLGKTRFKVGIVWSGNTDFKDNYKRAVPFTRFMPLLEIPGVQLYSLQKSAPEKELAAAFCNGIVLDLSPHLKDFSETAAVLKKLDLVIMTDSAVAHLAGSLGVPVWNLLHSSPFWAYFTDRDDSPWYPSMRFFRQPKAGDWDSVFKNVASELEKLAR